MHKQNPSSKSSMDNNTSHSAHIITSYDADEQISAFKEKNEVPKTKKEKTSKLQVPEN